MFLKSEPNTLNNTMKNRRDDKIPYNKYTNYKHI